MTLVPGHLHGMLHLRELLHADVAALSLLSVIFLLIQFLERQEISEEGKQRSMVDWGRREFMTNSAGR